MLSAQMKVKPFNIIDVVPHCYIIHGVGNNEGGEGSCLLFQKNDKFPLEKSTRWTLKNKTGDFVLLVDYANMEGGEKTVSRFTVQLPSSVVATGPKNVRISFNLDKNYLLTLEKAEIVEEIFSENVRGEAPDKKKKKYTDLIVITESFGLDRGQITKAIGLEKAMATADHHIIETADKRNELETYLYSMRDKLDGELKQYSTGSERDKLKHLMNDAEEWLYGSGFDSTKQQYERKIDGLKVLSDPIDTR